VRPITSVWTSAVEVAVSAIAWIGVGISTWRVTRTSISLPRASWASTWRMSAISLRKMVASVATRCGMVIGPSAIPIWGASSTTSGEGTIIPSRMSSTRPATPMVQAGLRAPITVAAGVWLLLLCAILPVRMTVLSGITTLIGASGDVSGFPPQTRGRSGREGRLSPGLGGSSCRGLVPPCPASKPPWAAGARGLRATSCSSLGPLPRPANKPPRAAGAGGRAATSPGDIAS